MYDFVSDFIVFLILDGLREVGLVILVGLDGVVGVLDVVLGVGVGFDFGLVFVLLLLVVLVLGFVFVCFDMFKSVVGVFWRFIVRFLFSFVFCGLFVIGVSVLDLVLLFIIDVFVGELVMGVFF